MFTPSQQRRVLLHRPVRALVRQLQRVGQRHVGQRVGAGAADRAGHVRDAVVDDVVDDVRRLRVRGRLARLEAAALVDGHVDHHRPRLHDLQVVAADEVRGLRTGDQHRADHEVGQPQAFEDVEPVAEDGRHVLRHHVVDVAQAVEVHVEDEDVRPEPGGDAGRVRARPRPRR